MRKGKIEQYRRDHHRGSDSIKGVGRCRFEILEDDGLL